MIADPSPLISAAENEKARRRRFVPQVTTITPDEIAHANRASTKMLLSLSATGKHVYGGTVSGAEKARRRARGKRARAARQAAR